MPMYFLKPGTDKKVLYCEKCNIEVTRDMEHCEDCQVCISGMDHHCVFFSKCIGSGNVYPFYLTIGGLIINFVLVAIFASMDGVFLE